MQKALRKLGLVGPMDFALHVPLRYEDETRITLLRDARPGEVVQIEGVVTSCEVTFRPRRQLIVTVDEPVIDTRSVAFKVKSVGWSKATWRRSSMRVRARVSISALMDAVFLSIWMVQW